MNKPTLFLLSVTCKDLYTLNIETSMLDIANISAEYNNTELLEYTIYHNYKPELIQSCIAAKYGNMTFIESNNLPTNYIVATYALTGTHIDIYEKYTHNASHIMQLHDFIAVLQSNNINFIKEVLQKYYYNNIVAKINILDIILIDDMYFNYHNVYLIESLTDETIIYILDTITDYVVALNIFDICTKNRTFEFILKIMNHPILSDTQIFDNEHLHRLFSINTSNTILPLLNYIINNTIFTHNKLTIHNIECFDVFSLINKHYEISNDSLDHILNNAVLNNKKEFIEYYKKNDPERLLGTGYVPAIETGNIELVNWIFNNSLHIDEYIDKETAYTAAIGSCSLEMFILVDNKFDNTFTGDTVNTKCNLETLKYIHNKYEKISEIFYENSLQYAIRNYMVDIIDYIINNNLCEISNVKINVLGHLLKYDNVEYLKILRKYGFDYCHNFGYFCCNSGMKKCYEYFAIETGYNKSPQFPKQLETYLPTLKQLSHGYICNHLLCRSYKRCILN
jgi:hypothetical protein